MFVRTFIPPSLSYTPVDSLPPPLSLSLWSKRFPLLVLSFNWIPAVRFVRVETETRRWTRWNSCKHRGQEGREGRKRRKTEWHKEEKRPKRERFSSIFMAPPSDDQNRNKREDGRVSVRCSGDPLLIGPTMFLLKGSRRKNGMRWTTNLDGSTG